MLRNKEDGRTRMKNLKPPPDYEEGWYAKLFGS